MATALGPALVSGGASVLGSGLGFLGSKGAQKQQAQQAADALTFAKEQAAQQQQNYEQQQAALKAQWEAQQATLAPRRAALASLLGSYGISAPATAAEPTSFSPSMLTQQASASAPPPQLNLASLMSGSAPARVQQANNQPPGLTLADLGFAGQGQLLQ